MVTIGTLNGGNITITTGGSAPATHEETWYKYYGDTEWRTVLLGGTIALVDDMGEPTDQIENPANIVAIEIGTGTTSNPVTSIGSDAFYNCIGLTSVKIPNSVTSIESGAFLGCSSLTSMTFEGKDRATVEEMNTFPFGLNYANINGVTIHCTDGNIQVQHD